MYSYDPLAGVPANETHLVIGGETYIWSEQTDSVNLDRMVWPRACAAADLTGEHSALCRKSRCTYSS
jgi:hexosaminidase